MHHGYGRKNPEVEKFHDAVFRLLSASEDVSDDERAVTAAQYREVVDGWGREAKVAMLNALDEASTSILPELSMQALYHHEPGRRYRPTKRERDTGKFECPRCHVTLVCTTRKAKDPLYRCPDCAWNIAKSDIFDPGAGEEPQLQPGEYPEGIAPPPEEQEGPW